MESAVASYLPHQQDFFTSKYQTFQKSMPDVSFSDVDIRHSEAMINQSEDNRKSRIRPESLLAKLGLPCQTITDYDYGQCYSYYANGCYNTCQFVDVGDIEDFM